MEKRGRGRPRLAPEDRVIPKVRKNISLDEECQNILNDYQDGLSKTLGFKPTLSQAVKHLIANQKR